MRRLAEVVAENRKARVDIEAEADTAVRRRQLEQTRERLRFEREQEEYEIANRLEIECQRINSSTELEASRTEAERQSEALRISKVGDVKQAEIERDLGSQAPRDAGASRSRRKPRSTMPSCSPRSAARSRWSRRRSKAYAPSWWRRRKASRPPRTSPRPSAARKLAALKAAQENETDDARIKSKVGTIIAVAKAESEAVQLRSSARARLDSIGGGDRTLGAQVEAENRQSETVLRARVEMHKIDKLPEIATQMMKPVEKIESIRINHIGGLGSGGGQAATARPFAAGPGFHPRNVGSTAVHEEARRRRSVSISTFATGWPYGGRRGQGRCLSIKKKSADDQQK